MGKQIEGWTSARQRAIDPCKERWGERQRPQEFLGGRGSRSGGQKAAEVASVLQTVVEQVDPLVDNETEASYRPQSTSKGGKHDLRTRWATNGVGSEVGPTLCMCTVDPQLRLGLEMDGAVCTTVQLSLSPLYAL